MNPDIKDSPIPTYSIQIRIFNDGVWSHRYRTHFPESAIRRARAMNRSWETGTASHRVVREQDDKVIYQCGYLDAAG